MSVHIDCLLVKIRFADVRFASQSIKEMGTNITTYLQDRGKSAGIDVINEQRQLDQQIEVDPCIIGVNRKRDTHVHQT